MGVNSFWGGLAEVTLRNRDPAGRRAYVGGGLRITERGDLSKNETEKAGPAPVEVISS